MNPAWKPILYLYQLVKNLLNGKPMQSDNQSF